MEISARTAAIMASEIYGMNRKISAERLVTVINDDIGGGLSSHLPLSKVSMELVPPKSIPMVACLSSAKINTKVMHF